MLHWSGINFLLSILAWKLVHLKKHNSGAGHTMDYVHYCFTFCASDF